jgi:hypothetical protein
VGHLALIRDSVDGLRAEDYAEQRTAMLREQADSGNARATPTSALVACLGQEIRDLRKSNVLGID